MDLTYSTLLQEHIARLTRQKLSVSQQSIRNQISTLNTFLTFVGKTIENRVGRELLLNFNQTTKEFLVQACSSNRKTGADKLSHLRAWKVTLDSLLSARRHASASDVSKFHAELRAALTRCAIPPQTLARQVGASRSAVQRWVSGAYPNERGLATLRRLEKGLGLARGHLEALLPTSDIPISIARANKDNYAKRLAENVKDRYRLPLTEFSENFRDEWLTLLRYKTAEFPAQLRRSPRGTWRTLPVEKVSRAYSTNDWIRLDEEYVCPTAERELETLRGFFGYLARLPDAHTGKGGQGLPSQEIQTLASIAVPEFVGGYFEFIKARSGGLVHGGHRTIATFFRSLLKPVDGYLSQQPHFLRRVEMYAGMRTWDELCAQTFELCGKWKQASAGKKSRDPKSPILPLLRLQSPLSPLFRAIKDLDRAASAAAPGSVLQASLKRDALLLSIALANPLRARTFTITKYIPDDLSMPSADMNTNLYRTEAGGWRLRYEKGDMKNDGSSDHDDYDAPLPQMLNDRIEDYLLEYRPVLIRKLPDSPWLFPSSKTGEKFSAIGKVIARIAKRYIPEVARLGPHAIRHIVATDFLAKNPGQYTVVAELLHDSLETVLANYAHLKQEKSFQAHEEHLKKAFSSA